MESLKTYSKCVILVFYSLLSPGLELTFLFCVCLFTFIFKLIYGVTLINKIYRFEEYYSIILHLYVILCAHHPKPNLLQSPYIWLPLFPAHPSFFSDINIFWPSSRILTHLLCPPFLTPVEQNGINHNSLLILYLQVCLFLLQVILQHHEVSMEWGKI